MFDYMSEFADHYKKLLKHSHFIAHQSNESPQWSYDFDHGTLAELRTKYDLAAIAGDADELSQLVNGNPEQTEWTSFYISYMAKNLFWFTSPQISTFNYEASKNRTTCYLLPEYFLPHELHGKKLDQDPSIQITNDPKLFWAQPITSGVSK